MKLIEDLRKIPELQAFFRDACEEEGISIGIDERIDKDQLLIIKPDDFYNSLRSAATPASVDCLIIQFCGGNRYKITLIELKNVEKPSNIDRKNLREKYETVLFDLIKDRWGEIFYQEGIQLSFQLILTAGKQQDKQIRPFSLDFLLGLLPFRIDGKILAIHGFPPDHPVIKPC